MICFIVQLYMYFDASDPHKVSVLFRINEIILQNLSSGRGNNRRLANPEVESLPNMDVRNARRPNTSSVAGGLPPLGRLVIYKYSLTLLMQLYFSLTSIDNFYKLIILVIIFAGLFHLLYHLVSS